MMVARQCLDVLREAALFKHMQRPMMIPVNLLTGQDPRLCDFRHFKLHLDCTLARHWHINLTMSSRQPRYKGKVFHYDSLRS